MWLVLYGVKRMMTVSKLEKEKFCFSSLDIKILDELIIFSMDDYVRKLEDVAEIRKERKRHNLSKLDLKIYRKMTRNIDYLVQSMRLKMCFAGFDMAKSRNLMTIQDLKEVNLVVKK